MSQQINLLDPSLLPRREWLSLGTVALGIGLVFAGLALASGWGAWQERRARELFGRTEEQLRIAQDELVRLAGAQARRQADPVLAARLAAAERALADKRQVMSLLEKGELGDRSGFSVYLQAFARLGVEGVWLTGLDLRAGGESLKIRGRLLQESLLPLYVQRLNAEPAFQGRRFSALDMRRVEPAGTANGATAPASGQAPYIEFVLGGTPPSSPEAPR